MILQRSAFPDLEAENGTHSGHKNGSVISFYLFYTHKTHHFHSNKSTPENVLSFWITLTHANCDVLIINSKSLAFESRWKLSFPTLCYFFHSIPSLQRQQIEKVELVEFVFRFYKVCSEVYIHPTIHCFSEMVFTFGCVFTQQVRGNYLFT